MNKLISLMLIVAGVALLSKTQVIFYAQSRDARFLSAWKKDIDTLLIKKKTFQKYFDSLYEVKIHFTDPDVAEEFDEIKAPFKAVNDGSYILRVSITRWIKGNEYGFIVQHEVFSKYKNKVDEFGRTYNIGFIW